MSGIKFNTCDSDRDRTKVEKDTIIQIITRELINSNNIYGLSENGNLYRLRYDGWVFTMESPTINRKE